MEEKYGEYLIKYVEFSEVFVAYDSKGDEESRSKSLSELKKRLDKIGETKKTFVRVPVLETSSCGFFEKGEITSITENKRLRVTWENGRRETLWYNHNPILDTPENREVYTEYKKVFDEIRELEEKLRNIESKFKRYEVPNGK